MATELESSSDQRFQLIGELSADSRIVQLGTDVKEGLGSRPFWLSPKYFYDNHGCELFDAICELPEYYPTRSELGLLRTSIPTILSQLHPKELIELGSGSSTKAEIFFDTPGCADFLTTYIPFDISATYITSSAERLIAKYPFLKVRGVVGDLETHIERIPHSPHKRLFVFLGSTIGNFDASARVSLLSRVAAQMQPPDSLLIGVDLQKDQGILERAYNDDSGVTAAFNLNILSVINRELNSNFDPSGFEHLAFYNDEHHRIEMHLVSKSAQHVIIPTIRESIAFADGDRIWTESSYKFTRPILEAELESANLRIRGWHESSDSKTRVALAIASLQQAPDVI